MFWIFVLFAFLIIEAIFMCILIFAGKADERIGRILKIFSVKPEYVSGAREWQN